MPIKYKDLNMTFDPTSLEKYRAKVSIMIIGLKKHE